MANVVGSIVSPDANIICAPRPSHARRRPPPTRPPRTRPPVHNAPTAHPPTAHPAPSAVGTSIDEGLEGEVSVTVVATNFGAEY